MKLTYHISFLFFFFFFGRALAQYNFSGHEHKTMDLKGKLIFTGSLKNNSPFENTFWQQNINPPPLIFHNQTPPGAIFCRMENSLHQRFNIWIRIRTGGI